MSRTVRVWFKVGPWPLPMTDQQRQTMDRLIARARARGLPFCSITDDARRECCAWVVEPLPALTLEYAHVEA